MEIQQSPQFIRYVESLGWKSESIEKTAIIYKHIPLIGGLTKIQRATKLPSSSKIISFIKKKHIRTLAIEPDASVSQHVFNTWLTKIQDTVKLNTNPYLPTKTIRVDLRPKEEEIFSNFTEAKRRAVRRALKNTIIIKESTNINDLIKIKNKSSGFFGFITTYGINKLWPGFAPDHAAILLAYSSVNREPFTIDSCVGGILLLFLDGVSYYWIAGATRLGKKLFAPTLLVWEAMKLSKRRGNKWFDFVGVIDERLPGTFKDWKGFTKFKEGFGGKALYYPVTITHR